MHAPARPVSDRTTYQSVSPDRPTAHLSARRQALAWRGCLLDCYRQEDLEQAELSPRRTLGVAGEAPHRMYLDVFQNE